MSFDNLFINQLLEALDHPEVSVKIRQILGGVETGSLQSEEREQMLQQIEELQSRLQEYQRIIDSKDQTIAVFKQEKTQMEAVLSTERTYFHEQLQQQQVELQRYKDNYLNLEKVYTLFLGLTPPVRSSLRGIFKGNSLPEFLYCGVQGENIDSLWEFIKKETIENKETDLASLKQIFSFFFDAYNKIFDTPVFQLLKTAAGERFSEDYHIRGGNSKVIGVISEVLLEGYFNSITNRVVKKSIVRI
ncbi:hypothetical protein [Neobacillus dielmonensis]|uniref:hypothetical protein n=1 Tax=Neobacillus dielmonensis TaxID=1347369 RepID=UPI0005A87D21|nr:hypothetical protein [Neobacillus dielmonensis]